MTKISGDYEKNIPSEATRRAEGITDNNKVEKNTHKSADSVTKSTLHATHLNQIDITSPPLPKTDNIPTETHINIDFYKKILDELRAMKLSIETQLEVSLPLADAFQEAVFSGKPFSIPNHLFNGMSEEDIQFFKNKEEELAAEFNHHLESQGHTEGERVVFNLWRDQSYIAKMYTLILSLTIILANNKSLEMKIRGESIERSGVIGQTVADIKKTKRELQAYNAWTKAAKSVTSMAVQGWGMGMQANIYDEAKKSFDERTISLQDKITTAENALTTANFVNQGVVIQPPQDSDQLSNWESYIASKKELDFLNKSGYDTKSVSDKYNSLLETARGSLQLPESIFEANANLLTGEEEASEELWNSEQRRLEEDKNRAKDEYQTLREFITKLEELMTNKIDSLNRVTGISGR